ncbi:MAG: PAS domain S-box protein [Armatimonadota bacterium]
MTVKSLLRKTRTKTKKKTAARKKQASADTPVEKIYKDLYANAPAAYFSISSGGIIGRCNKKACSLLGYKEKELIGKRVFELYADTPDGKDKAKKIFKRFVKGEKIANEELQMEKKNEKTIWISLSVSPVKDPLNKVIASRSVVIDITEQKKNKEESKKSSEIYKALIESADDLIYMMDKKGRLISFNKATEKAFGKPASKIKGRTYHELFPKKQADSFVKNHNKVIRTGEVFSEESVLKVGGNKFWTSVVLAPVKDNKGGVFAVMGISRDITDRKKAERKYSLVVQNSFDGFWLTDTKGRFLDVNEAYCKMTGYSKSELMKMKVIDVEIIESSEETQKHIEKVMRNGYDKFETRHRRRNGGIIDVEISVNYLDARELEESQFAVFIRNITDRKVVEQALAQNRRSLLEAQKIAHLGSWDWDVGSGILTWSDEMFRIWGFEPGEFVPKYEDFLNSLHPDDLEVVKKAVNDTLTLNKPYDIEYRIKLHRGGERIVKAQGMADFAPDGNPVRMFGTALDITEQKEKQGKILKQSKIISGINKIFSEALICETEEKLAKKFLEVAENVSGSKFGFVGELNSKGLFDTIAVSNPGWDSCNMAVTDARKYTVSMPIRGIDRMTLKEGKPRIVNDTVSHPDRIGVPEGHPAITCFLGVPLNQGSRVIGMIGLANKETGYDILDQEYIEALSVAFVEALYKKRADRAVKESESRFKLLFDSLTEGVALGDMETGNLYMVNDKFAEMTGYSKEELRNFSPVNFHPQKNAKFVSGVFEKAATGEERFVKDIPYMRKDRSVFYADMGLNMIELEGKKYMMVSVRDISELKELRIKEQEERERAGLYLNIAGVIIVALDGEGKVTLINKKGCEVLEHELGDIIGKNWFDNFLPEIMRDEVKESFHKIISGDLEGLEYYENPVLTKSGEKRLIAWHNTYIKDEKGSVCGTLTSGEDITEKTEIKKQMESRLHELEVFHKAAIDREDRILELKKKIQELEEGKEDEE